MLFPKGLLPPRRNAGFGSVLSKSKLVKIMLNALLQLPIGTQYLKETIIQNIGFAGMMSGTRELNAAWTEVKRKAAKEYPERFILGERDVLIWNDGTKKALDKKISPLNIRKLNDLADLEGCDVNEIIKKLIKAYPVKNTKSNDNQEK